MKKAPIDEGRFRASDIRESKPGRAIERDGGMVGLIAARCQPGGCYSLPMAHTHFMRPGPAGDPQPPEELTQDEARLIRTYRATAPLTVRVTFGDGMYTAQCQRLHLVTEAATLDELHKRVVELVPEMIEANNLKMDVRLVRLQFAFAEPLATQAGAR